MEKREILQKLIDYYAKGNKSEFGRILGLTPQAITSWLRRNTFDAELINAKCINVNSDWLLTGEGEMVTKNKGQEQIPTSMPVANPCDVEKILLSIQHEVAENNKFMREQMNIMQSMLNEAMQLLKKSQEYYERALELHEGGDVSVHYPHTSYLAEPHMHK